jgi:hypothetical protein
MSRDDTQKLVLVSRETLGRRHARGDGYGQDAFAADGLRKRERAVSL